MKLSTTSLRHYILPAILVTLWVVSHVIYDHTQVVYSRDTVYLGLNITVSGNNSFGTEGLFLPIVHYCSDELYYSNILMRERERCDNPPFPNNPFFIIWNSFAQGWNTILPILYAFLYFIVFFPILSVLHVSIQVWNFVVPTLYQLFDLVVIQSIVFLVNLFYSPVSWIVRILSYFFIELRLIMSFAAIFSVLFGFLALSLLFFSKHYPDRLFAFLSPDLFGEEFPKCKKIHQSMKRGLHFIFQFVGKILTKIADVCCQCEIYLKESVKKEE